MFNVGDDHDAGKRCFDFGREVVALRHFEELTNQGVAIELGITPKTASIRYVRALERLRHVLEKL